MTPAFATAAAAAAAAALAAAGTTAPPAALSSWTAPLVPIVVECAASQQACPNCFGLAHARCAVHCGPWALW